ncbi:hypothetical protein [Proteus columbae]|uniref:hypothetical protein n=1 Tax=Proteus columbae TaxID=1987580 RepID=UPI002889559A|nr:hypothetical protein [Proteus columbae]
MDNPFKVIYVSIEEAKAISTKVNQDTRHKVAMGELPLVNYEFTHELGADRSAVVTVNYDGLWFASLTHPDTGVELLRLPVILDN